VTLSMVEEVPAPMRHFDAEETSDPIALFRKWMHEAAATEPNDPDAVALATVSPEGNPSVRMVLMKGLDERGFSFFTNAESQKGRELLHIPRAAMCFHWKTQRRQIRVQGSVRELPLEEADAYFHSRARRSQIGAAVSAQSRPLQSREVLERAANECNSRYPGEIPRPAYWRGFVLDPEHIEFWQDGAFRLHDRIVFSRADHGWDKTRLYP
jgi:pyridoxamine 5'-phosphate oxidase